MNIRISLALLLCLLCSPEVRARQFRGMEFADKVLVEQWGSVLSLTGVSSVDRHYLPLQLVALYSDPRQGDPRALVDALAPCRITIRWQVSPGLNDADAAAYWHERIEQSKIDPDQMQHLSSTFNRMISAFGAAKRGDELILDYDPEQGLRIMRNGQITGQFAGVALSRAVLGLWLSGDTALKRELLGQAVAPEEKL